MAFSIDRTRSFIRIEESNLLSLYRSTDPIIPTEEHCHGHICDAFICVAQEYNLWRVYIALHDQLLKSNLVFVTDPIRPDEKKLAAIVQEAKSMLGEFGFSMETINLNFSPATREVVIKDIKVLREPSLALQLDAARLAVEELLAEKTEYTKKSVQEQKALKDELEEIREKLVAATAVQKAAKVLPTASDSVDDSHPQVKLSSREKTELEAVGEEEEQLRASLLDAENLSQKLREELSNIKVMLKNTRESLKTTKDEAKQYKEDLKSSNHESILLNKKLKAKQADLDSAKNDLKAVGLELAEAQEAYESAKNNLIADKENLEAIHRAQIKELNAEITRLNGVLEDKDNTAEMEVWRAAIAVAEESLSMEKSKNESVLQEMDALERNAAAELKLLKKKVDSLTADKLLLEKMSAEMKIKASGEIERLQQVNQSQRRVAIKKVNALKEEIRQLAEARALIASPTGIPSVQTGKGLSPLQADSKNEISINTQGAASFASDPFASYDPSEQLNFLPDKSLKGIPYSFLGDIVEVYRSFNTIHAAPTGKQAQKCDGFVCLVNEGGQYLVYVAWLMNSSGEVLVCRPECNVDDQDSYQQILREGIGYFERIGFIIDKLNLEGEPEKRQVQIDGLAVFCHSPGDCADDLRNAS